MPQDVVKPKFEVSISKKQRKSVLFIQKQGYLSLSEFSSDIYSIDLVFNNKGGVSQALASIPDLIVMNCKQLDTDDINDVKYLKSNVLTHHIPIVILSSLVNKQVQLQCLKIGVDAILSHPVDPCVLEAQIKSLLQSRDQLKAIYQQDSHLIDKINVETSDQLFLNRVRGIVLDNISNTSFNIEELVRVMKVSRTFLYVKVKSLTNQATSEFVRDIRLKEAAKLLKKGIYNVSEVAFQVGFSDPKYLSRRFKEKFGISPSVFHKGHVIDSK